PCDHWARRRRYSAPGSNQIREFCCAASSLDRGRLARVGRGIVVGLAPRAWDARDDHHLIKIDMTRVIAGDGTDPLAMHKPGPRRLADQAADDRSARSYAEMVKRMSDNWRTPERAKADAERDCIIARDEITFDDYRRRCDEAYSRMCERLRNSWKRS